jgi:hypothetical protein
MEMSGGREVVVVGGREVAGTVMGGLTAVGTGRPLDGGSSPVGRASDGTGDGVVAGGCNGADSMPG